MLSRYPDLRQLIASGEDEEMSHRLRRAESIGRPIGDPAFLRLLETTSGRSFSPQKRGRKPKEKSALST
jgi:putative transposase